jgi:hypothetical protein
MPSSLTQKQALDAGLCKYCRENKRAIAQQGKTEGELSQGCKECNEKRAEKNRARSQERTQVNQARRDELARERKQEELTEALIDALTAAKIADMYALGFYAAPIDKVREEYAQEVRMAGGADKWVAERREEEARRQSREFKRHYDQYFSTEAF